MAKQADISNKTLATLLVVAIVVSIGGTYVVLQKAPGITGLFTATDANGTITFTSEGVLSIKINDASVAFGNISSNAPGLCTITSDGNAFNNCWGNATGNKYTSITDYMEVENDGNVAAELNVSIVGTAFSLGTGGAQLYKASEPTAGCAGTLQDSYTALSSAKKQVCSNLAFTDGADTVRVFYNLTLGSDIMPGAQSQNVTFWAALV